MSRKVFISVRSKTSGFKMQISLRLVNSKTNRLHWDFIERMNKFEQLNKVDNDFFGRFPDEILQKFLEKCMKESLMVFMMVSLEAYLKKSLEAYLKEHL